MGRVDWNGPGGLAAALSLERALLGARAKRRTPPAADAAASGGRVGLPGRRRDRRERRGGALLACAALAVWAAGCSGQGGHAPAPAAGETAPAPDAAEGTARIEVLTFRTASSYIDYPPVVMAGNSAVVFVAADEFDRWFSDNTDGPYGDTAEDSARGPWRVSFTYDDEDPSRWDPEPDSLSPHQARTNKHGQATAHIPAGDYHACVSKILSDYNRSRFTWMIVGCGAVQISHGSVVYVFFDQGRAFIDTGDGPAFDAYRRLDCRQQRLLGQTPEDLVHRGGDRGRCPSR